MIQGVKEKPYYSRAALVGIAMYLFIAAVILVAILIFEPSSAAFPIIIAVVASIVGALIYFLKQPWGSVFAVLGGAFGVLFGLDGVALALSSPQSFFDFAFTLFVLPGGILILVAGITGLVQHFKHSTSATGPAGVTLAIKGGLGVIVALAIISAVLTVASIGGLSAAEKEGAETITAEEAKFDKDALTASASGTTKIVFKNDDPYLHTFTIDDLDVDLKVGPGSEKLAELNSPKAGTYEFYCRVAGHENMKGILTVQ